MNVGAALPGLAAAPSNRRLWQALEVIDRVIAHTVASTRSPGHGDHPLAMLLEARDEVHSCLNDREIRDEAIAFFLAGHETTALALTFALFLLSEHPAEARRLEAEVDAVLAGRTPTLADLPHLEHTGRVVREVMRLYPPAYAFAREARKDVGIGGHRVPKGATVIVAPWLVHRDPRWWDRPWASRPDRWEEGSSSACHAVPTPAPARTAASASSSPGPRRPPCSR